MSTSFEELSLTLKVRLYPTNSQADEFNKVTQEYKRLCNIASKEAFTKNIILQKSSQRKLNDLLYYKFKTITFLRTQIIQSVFRTVIARYKAIKTQMQSNPFKYYDSNAKQLYVVKKDLSWLTHPVQFNRPQIDLVRNSNYALTNNANQLSIAGINGRLKVNYDLNCKKYLLDDNIKLGTAKLVKVCGHWFLHINYTYKVPVLEMNDVKNVVGIDRGQRFITVSYDSHGKTSFINGKKLLFVRRHYKNLRRQLQLKNTKSSKRKIRKINQRENRYVTDINHRISKALVNYYGKNTLFVLEDLTGIRTNTEKRKKDKKYESVSWPFYQLQQMLEYKAKKNHSKVVYVDAYKTSQRCVKCGRINKNNRNHSKHLYICDKCGYQSNDDRLAAMNIYCLGTLVRNNVISPSFRSKSTASRNFNDYQTYFDS